MDLTNAKQILHTNATETGHRTKETCEILIWYMTNRRPADKMQRCADCGVVLNV